MELPELADRLDDLSPAPACRCPRCGRRFADYPYSFCSACGGELEPAELAKEGTVLAITRSHRRREQTIFAAPYTVALVQEELGETPGAFLCVADDPEARLNVTSRVKFVQRRWQLSDGSVLSAVVALPEDA